jgi:hypothetical protein
MGPNLTISPSSVNFHHQVFLRFEQNIEELIETLLRDLVQYFLADIPLNLRNLKATPALTNRDATRGR